MYPTTGFPHHVHWNSHELADAVPRRLSELYRFDVRLDAPDIRCANADPRLSHPPPGYLPASALPERFQVD